MLESRCKVSFLDDSRIVNPSNLSQIRALDFSGIWPRLADYLVTVTLAEVCWR